MAHDDGVMPIHTTAVAVDKDKHSQYAVKWAIDHLMNGCNFLILVHVKTRNPDGGIPALEPDSQQIFIPYRGFCARKSVQLKEVVLEETDVAKAIIDYVSNNYITNIVLGASTRNALVKTFKKPDIPSHINKYVPEFCSVYIIGKTKVLSVRSAQRPIANTAAPPRLPASSMLQHQSPQESHTPRTPCLRTNTIGADRSNIERNSESIKVIRGRPSPSNSLKASNLSMESIDIISGPSSSPGSCRSSLSDDDNILDPFAFHNSLNMSPKNSDFSFVGGDSRRDEGSAGHDLEAEMRRLRLELKQTMDMYSTACKEAITAKQKANELNEWKKEELRRIEQARLSEESALAIVEMEKAKCKAAIEAAEAAQKLAEKEAQKRKLAEMKAKREAEEKNRALSQLAHNDVRYRRYTIEEIEVATEKFASQSKVGEGGYGPVYRGTLDHTPVAIKVLRPDAAQGRKQFQQEVEVLSCMRHPHMVLLLGACPEYGCLVYEFMNYGSLEDRLYRKGGTHPIPWRIRFKIAAEIATALSFIHQAKPEPLVHRDLKPANILLDRNYVSKISDVGLARLVPPSIADSVTQYHMTSAAGTFCYIDPEYQQTGRLTTKSDVYSFGILLLQIITAKPPMGLSHHVSRAIDLGTFNDMLDKTVHDWPIEEALAFAKVALKCCELRKKDRPDLATVVLPELNRLREFGMSEDANHLYTYHPTNSSLVSRRGSSTSSGSHSRSSDTTQVYHQYRI
ncbi:U-box domain-containing protein 52-like isoform X1 [Silene latifolia]|uniref:U-box domain-containing protein 52-like isoform X1 n=1 Tax=Silene latifolia TaxID=37657 RepID=UPI003D787801